MHRRIVLYIEPYIHARYFDNADLATLSILADQLNLYRRE